MDYDKEIYFLMSALDESNIECAKLINSREYLLGKRLLAFGDALRNFDIKKIFAILKGKIARKKLNEKKLEYCCRETVNVGSGRSFSLDKKYAVYTCITGNYDLLLEPLYKHENIDYFVFSDKKLNSNSWKYIPIPEQIKKMDNAMINRYIKLHPKEFFPNYDYTLYVDGNVKVVSDIRRLACCTNCDCGIAMFDHCLRDCLYEEAKTCVLYGKGNKKGITEQIAEYKENRFPEHFGLKEGTVIFTDISNKKAESFFNNWWKELDRSKSKRDQLSFPYSLWVNGADLSSVGTLGSNVYINNFFRVYSH